jgi:rod shape-determining protein MreD
MALQTLRLMRGRRVEASLARLLPIATTTLAAVLSILPVPIPGYRGITPAFVLMAVFHWTVYRPDLLPAIALFLIGTGEDLLSGAPLGTTALVLLLARFLVLGSRRFFANRLFPFVWTGFVVLSGAAMVFLWALNSLLDWALLEYRSAVFRLALTVALFPVASFLLGRTQRALLPAAR